MNAGETGAKARSKVFPDSRLIQPSAHAVYGVAKEGNRREACGQPGRLEDEVGMEMPHDRGLDLPEFFAHGRELMEKRQRGRIVAKEDHAPIGGERVKSFLDLSQVSLAQTTPFVPFIGQDLRCVDRQRCE